ncbi:nucleotidyltransferase family protein [Marinilongibacter aquaticus]|uniref:nucleotidyltransferase family protein n=1 Tax=Marinilongibacter aquaticus TaxID=2975157 RepID=UPI0021BD0681|nr:nucleotidyltransferase family protein [Marinilongibacter aquaticus]UBM59696.1 nucleotidyltransferase family protein [Marinilongibacter aquaticus]
MNVGIIILAAGESKRMGLPKQTLDLFGRPMLLRTIDAALANTVFPVTVVLGAHKQAVAPMLVDLPINIVDNPHWQTGMASSLKMGMVGSYLITKALDAVLICTVDMPEVDEHVIRRLLEKAQTSDSLIVCSQYGEVKGVPAIIKRPLFTELLELEGDQGARQIFKKHAKEIDTIDFPEGRIDLDSKEDYFEYINAKN